MHSATSKIPTFIVLFAALGMIGSDFTAFASGGQSATFTPLGDLPGGDFRSVARGISDDGSIIVGQSFNAPGMAASFRWTSDSGMTSLAAPAGWPVAECTDICGDGLTILGSGVTSSDLKNHLAAVYWPRSLSPVNLDGAFEPYSMLTGATPHGELLIGADRMGWSHEPGFSSSYGFVFNAAAVQVTYLPDLLGGMSFFDNCAPADVSEDGTIIVGFGETSVSIDAVRWLLTDDGWQVQSLGHLPGGFGFSQATAVTGDGGFIAGISATPLGYEPFLWTGATIAGARMVSLGAPPHKGYESGAVSAITADGQTVIGSWSWGLFPGLEGDGIAFMWTAAQGMRDLRDALADDYDLELPGWQLTAATDITPDGRYIIGNAINPQGDFEAWLIDLQPQPSPPGPGDANGDGVVNIDDLLIVINSWTPAPEPGLCPAPCPGDVDGNGTVDIDDLLLMINNWG